MNLVSKKVFEMKLRQNLHLLGTLSRKTYITVTKSYQFFVYRDSNLKICLQPGLEAQKVEKHWLR